LFVTKGCWPLTPIVLTEVTTDHVGHPATNRLFFFVLFLGLFSSYFPPQQLHVVGLILRFVTWNFPEVFFFDFPCFLVPSLPLLCPLFFSPEVFYLLPSPFPFFSPY